MNAMIGPVSDVRKLTRRQMKMIRNIANRKEDPYCKRAERLRSLKFCTDDVKFQALKMDDTISNELYGCLYDIYFGVTSEEAQPAPEDQAKTEEPTDVQANTEQPKVLPDGFSEVSPEAITQKTKKTRARDKRDKQHRKCFTNEQNRAFVRDYLTGISTDDLAKKYGLTKQQVMKKIYNLTKSGWMEDTEKMDTEKGNMAVSKPSEQQEEKFNEIIESVDAGKCQEPETTAETDPVTVPMKNAPSTPTFKAKGTGFLTTDGGLKLDEEPILSMIRQAIMEKGLMQFYADVEILIRPVEPVGMVVTVEE